MVGSVSYAQLDGLGSSTAPRDGANLVERGPQQEGSHDG